MKQTKRSLAILLTLLLLLGLFPFGVFASSDELDTGQEETVNSDATSEVLVISDDPADESTDVFADDPEPASVPDKTPPVEETTPARLSDYADTYDTSAANTVDLSSRRLLVSADEADIITEDAILAELDGLYLMQFEDETETKLAYLYYNDKAGHADADSPVMIADDEVVAIENADPNPVEMDEETNPFTEVQTAIDGIGSMPTDISRPVIALIDTGANGEHITRYSVMGDDGTDSHGHGTRMAEIITDICPEAQIVSIKATDDSGVGSTSTIYAALQLALELHADIINLSVYGLRSTENSALETAIQTAMSSGIAVVGAAGNSGRNAASYFPGCISGAVIVGSVNEDGTLAAFSNYGESVDYYVVSGSTSEAAATVSALTAAGCLIVDNRHIYAVPLESNDDPEETTEAPEPARTFLYTYLCDPDAVTEAFGFGYVPTIDELTPYLYRSANESSYETILLAVDTWNHDLSSADRDAVNAALDAAQSGLSYEALAHAAYDYAMENHDGKLRLDYFTVDMENESIEQHEAYAELGELVLVTEPELVNDEMKIAAYSSTESFVATVSAKYENQFSSTYSYYASNGSKIMNMRVTQYLDFYTGQKTRDSYGDIKAHYLAGYRAYCARPSGSFPAGYYVSNSAGNTFWSKLSWNQVYGMVKAVGYSDYIIGDYYWESAVAAATQVVVWSLAGNHMDKYGYSGTYYDDGYFWNRAYNLTDSTTYWEALARLRDLMWVHGRKPIFSYSTTDEANANPYEPTYDAANNVYTYTWTEYETSTDYDKRGTQRTTWLDGKTYLETLFSFDALDDEGNKIDGITFSVSGANVTMTATPEAMATSDVITIRVNTPTRDFSDEYFGIYYSSSAGGQPAATMFGGKGKPVYAWMAVKGAEQAVSVRVHKTTDDSYASMVSGNTCYDLSGTQFVVYETLAEAQANSASDRVSFDVVDASGSVTSSGQTVMTVGANGYTPYIRLMPGKTYYVREITASRGYVLPAGNSAIRSISVTSDERQTFVISNIPADDPVSITLGKTNYAGTPPVPLTGAKFQIRYYPGIYNQNNLPSSASRTWVIQTVQIGSTFHASFDNPGSIVAAQSDAFWVKTSTGVTEKPAANLTSTDITNLRFPFGTYVITEQEAAPGYLNDPNFTIGNHSAGDTLVIRIQPTSDTDATPKWTLADGSLVTELPVSATNTAIVADTVMPVITTELTGDNGAKEPSAKRLVTLTDAVTITTLDDFQGHTLRVEGHLYLLSPDGTTISEVGNGATAQTASFRVSSLTYSLSFSYILDARELYNRTLVAYVELYDENNRLIASHTDRNETAQQVTFRQNPGSITITKQDASGRDLAGAVYLLEYSLSENGSWTPVFAHDGSGGYVVGGCSSAGLAADGTLTTGADGKAVFSGLLADNAVFYRLTEVQAPEGCQLLAESVLVGTLPQYAPEEMYDISYTVTDSAVFNLPRTGSHGFAWLPFTVAGLLIAGTGFTLTTKRRAHKH